MNRLFTAAVAIAVTALLAPTPSSAQAGVFVDGGVTFPLGDFKDFGGGDGAKTGWVANVGALFAVAPTINVGATGSYGSNNHETSGDKTNLLGGFGLVEWVMDAAAATPFVYGGAGYLSHAYKSDTASDVTDSGFAYLLGAGYGVPVGSVSIYGRGYWMKGAGDISSTQLFGFSAGIYVPLGGGGM